MKITLLLVSLALLLTACGSTTPSTGTEMRPAHCDMDNLICPDGSIVMRTGENCEFVCPQDKTPQAECDYAAADRRYFSRYDDMCAQIPPNCQKGEEYFKDSCGCGCILA